MLDITTGWELSNLDFLGFTPDWTLVWAGEGGKRIIIKVPLLYLSFTEGGLDLGCLGTPGIP